MHRSLGVTHLLPPVRSVVHSAKDDGTPEGADHGESSAEPNITEVHVSVQAAALEDAVPWNLPNVNPPSEQAVEVETGVSEAG